MQKDPMFESFDLNYFATEFPKNVCDNATKLEMYKIKLLQTGWPMEYMKDTPKIIPKLKKRDLILFLQNCS